MDILALPDSNQLYVVVGGHAAAGRLLNLAARLAVRSPLLILDCGNRANPIPLARELRRLTHDPVRALSNIHTARAFTCYQVIALLENAIHRPQKYPVLIFDLLATFYDESVPYSEGRRLLEECIQLIGYIRLTSPLVVSAKPPPADFPERKSFLERICGFADQFWVEEMPPDALSRQLSFFN
ncbi:MAG: hypothetical protein LWX83_11010 [Anaerolineae bacterium]|nr:hypothetical protein [Anaerolineae bacterium]